MADERTVFSGVDLTELEESVETAVGEELERTSCSSAHPASDVHHPEGHPERSLLTQNPKRLSSE